MTDQFSCPHCGCGYTSHLGADTRAGRYCVQCGQYAGFPDANPPRGSWPHGYGVCRLSDSARSDLARCPVRPPIH